MSLKQVLFKGLPVVLIAAIIIVIAVVTGRPRPEPQVNDANKVIVNFEGLQINKSSLYDMMKQNGGLKALTDYMDAELLANYADRVDYDALEKEIEDAKEAQGDKFYVNLTNMGVILGEDDPNAEEKIEEYYLTKYLRKAYAKQVATDAITEEDKTKAYEEYKQDLCIMTLTFNTKAKADEQLATLLTKEGQAVQEEFNRVWRLQNPEGVTNKELPDFLQGIFTCEYERAVYSDYTAVNAELRDFIFKDEYLGEAFNVGNYNAVPKLYNGKYIIVYKVSQAPDKSLYPQGLFNQFLIDQLIGNKVDDAYINTKITELRTTSELKIYDSEIAAQYKYTVPTFVGEKDVKDKNTVASYKNASGEVVNISADQLYDLLKSQYAVQTLLDKLNYRALNSIPEIALTEAERNNYTQQVTNLKTQFLSSGYGQYMTWADYIAAYYGAFSDEELAERFASTELSRRFLLGTDTYAGADPVTDEVVQAAYTNWFNIQASHILLTYDNDNLESKLIADVKAHQIILGFAATKTLFETELANPASESKARYYDLYNGIASDKATEIISTNYITYDSKPFTGLDNTEGTQISSVFQALAKSYSEDPGSKDKGGDLGYFGPGAMVEPFEDEAKALAARGKGSYSDTPVASVIPTPDGDTYGFHVVYVTNVRTRTAKPANYDEIEDPSISTDAAVKAYYNFITGIKQELEAKHTTAENYAKHLALLLQSRNFSFNDDEIQAQYEAIRDIQIAYDRDETDSE